LKHFYPQMMQMTQMSLEIAALPDIVFLSSASSASSADNLLGHPDEGLCMIGQAFGDKGLI